MSKVAFHPPIWVGWGYDEATAMSALSVYANVDYPSSEAPVRSVPIRVVPGPPLAVDAVSMAGPVVMPCPRAQCCGHCRGN